MREPTALRAAVAPEIFERHPGYVVEIVVADGLTNGPSDEATGELLSTAERDLRRQGLARAADHPHVAAWRQAYSAFGAKPSKYPSSVEALAARVLKGQALPRVNRLVDIYNAVSVRHLLPVGGEDADALRGCLRLVVGDGGEPFDPRGDGGDVEAATPGEIVWRDDAGVTCRRWNWRQGRRTQLTEQTRRAFFVLDALPPAGRAELATAADDLARRITAHSPGARVSRLTIDADGPR
jgi:DNA/RNA-binding domain of Phe-tRNA-synthetase-like protein